jgi:integrase
LLPCAAGLPDTAATRLLEQQALEYEGADIAASTRVEYAAHWKYWLRFCLLFGLLQFCYAPCERVVVWYATWLSRSCNPRVVATYLSGLKHHLQAAGLVPAAVWAGWAHLPRVLKGIKRLRGTPVSRKLAITPAMLGAMARAVAMTPDNLCVWCAMLVCFYAFLRKSHVCVGGSTLLVPHLLLQRQHVVIDLAAYAIIVTVRFTKTAQYNAGARTIVIQGVRGGLLDPVRWLARYFAMVPAPPDSPCFVARDAQGQLRPLQYAALVGRLKAWLAAAGYDPAAFSGHSLRRGGATAAFQAGVDPLFIRLQGGWSSDAWLLYVGMSPVQKRQVTLRMQQAFLRMPGLGATPAVRGG